MRLSREIEANLISRRARALDAEAYTVQQQRAVDGTDLGGGFAVSDPSDAFEEQAKDAADRMMGGAAPAPIGSGGGGSGASVQRVVQREESDGGGDYYDMAKKGLTSAARTRCRTAASTIRARARPPTSAAAGRANADDDLAAGQQQEDEQA